MFRPLFALVLAPLAFAFIGAPAAAQEHSPNVGAIEGLITTQKATIRLNGAQVIVHGPGNRDLATVLSEGDGHYRVAALPEGRYTITATLEGFAVGRASAVVTADQTATVSIDLAIATVTDTVQVIAPTSIVSAADTIGSAESIGGKEEEQLAAGTGLTGALRLLASVIEVPSGVSIKGGRPTQAGVQMGASTLTDPVLGLVHLTLPEDAIDSVAVLPNPYAVEYGRFSSGLVVIQTRRAGDQWRMRLNDLSPTLRSKRHEDLYNINGLAGIAPNFEVGGPLIKNRLFLEQTAQYRYSSDDIPSRPEEERRTTNWFSSFTRVDANLSPRHSLIVTGGFFPSVTTLATLGTFTPPDATVDNHERVNHATVTERALWSDTLVSESTVQIRSYRAQIVPQGTQPMQLYPETTLGNFFNTQTRTPGTFQLIQTLSGSAQGPIGLHLFKFGVDLLSNNYSGSSDSRPFLIYRSVVDPTLARRLDFTGPSAQQLQTTDVAFFAQDRMQPSTRWYLEYGARLDRDGIVGRWNVTPRVGAAWLLNPSGTSVLRGGIGLFYERTPSAAGAFEQFETFTDTRVAADGTTTLEGPIPFVRVAAPNLKTARSTTMDASYEYRWTPDLTLHASVLRRNGSHELLLDALRVGPTGQIILNSSGISRYGDVEVGFHYSHSNVVDFSGSYAHASAEGDLNSFANYFDTMIWPVVTPNQYGPLATDVPHRFLARGRLLPRQRWLILGVADWRTGLPYSTVNEYLDFVGPRNQLRLPNYFRLDLGLEHRFHILKFEPWIGVRAYNALNSFLPADVQANIASPAFGSLYNSQFRQYRLQVRFER